MSSWIIHESFDSCKPVVSTIASWLHCLGHRGQCVRSKLRTHLEVSIMSTSTSLNIRRNLNDLTAFYCLVLAEKTEGAKASWQEWAWSTWDMARRPVSVERRELCKRSRMWGQRGDGDRLCRALKVLSSGWICLFPNPWTLWTFSYMAKILLRKIILSKGACPGLSR